MKISTSSDQNTKILRLHTAMYFYVIIASQFTFIFYKKSIIPIYNRLPFKKNVLFDKFVTKIF